MADVLNIYRINIMEPILIVIMRVVFVLLILVGMALVLLGINHYLLKPEENDMDRLRKDIEETDDVISKDSIFHTFLVRDRRGDKEKRSHSILKHRH